MSSKAEKILEKMRCSKAGWKAHDFRTLYEGFGFNKRGTRHDIYIHPDYPDIRDSIPRGSDELASGYAKDAVKNIDLLLAREKEKNDE
jgi:hypothetical protein